MKTKMLLIVTLGLIISSCSKKNLEKTEETSTEGFTITQALEEYENKTLDFETLKAKARCKYEDEDRSLSFTTNLRIKKDEIIWVSATMFGIEGARALITPDSVKIINRLERNYYKESTEKLQDLSGLPVDFEMLQAMVTGKILMVNDDTATITQKDGVYELISTLADITAIAWLDDANFLMRKQNVLEESLNSEMVINYHEYEFVDRYQFPFQTTVNVSGEKELSLEMEFTSLELNESLSFPFSINKNYNREEL